MKKLIIPILFLASCSPKYTRTIYYSDNVKKCIKNMEVLEDFVKQDYLSGKIPKDVATNYWLILEKTKYSLTKKYNKINNIKDDK